MITTPLYKNLFLIFLIGLLTACASGPRSVTISEAELQQRITEQLSVPISLLKIFDINLTNPVIRLDEGTERLNAQIDTKIINPLSGELLVGKINISGKLRFDSSRSAVMLTESRIENLDIEAMGIEDKYSNLFNVFAAKLGVELLNDVPLYILNPEDLKVGNTRYAPSGFDIVGRNLKITLQPQ